MKKIYCLIVLSLLANVSAAFAQDANEEKDQEYSVLPPLSYKRHR